MPAVNPFQWIAASDDTLRLLRLRDLKLGQLFHALQVAEDSLGLFFVNPADGEPDMNYDVVADTGVGCVGQAHVLGDAPKADFTNG